MEGRSIMRTMKTVIRTKTTGRRTMERSTITMGRRATAMILVKRVSFL